MPSAAALMPSSEAVIFALPELRTMSAPSRPSLDLRIVMSAPSTVSVASEWIASSPALTVIVPPLSAKLPPALMPSFAAVMLTVAPSTVMSAAARSASASEPLMPFLALPLTFSVPVPVMVRVLPALALIAAPS